MNDERLIKIEEKIAFQEDQIEELNKTVFQQQQRLEQLEMFCKELAGRIRSLSRDGSEGPAANERPPHY
jgi:SlyX protein